MIHVRAIWNVTIRVAYVAAIAIATLAAAAGLTAALVKLTEIDPPFALGFVLVAMWLSFAFALGVRNELRRLRRNERTKPEPRGSWVP